MDDNFILIVSSLFLLFHQFYLEGCSHTSLAGQWILLFFLCPLLAYDAYKEGKKSTLRWL